VVSLGGVWPSQKQSGFPGGGGGGCGGVLIPGTFPGSKTRPPLGRPACKKTWTLYASAWHSSKMLMLRAQSLNSFGEQLIRSPSGPRYSIAEKMCQLFT
jgi:hypothetical protein